MKNNQQTEYTTKRKAIVSIILGIVGIILVKLAWNFLFPFFSLIILTGTFFIGIVGVIFGLKEINLRKFPAIIGVILNIIVFSASLYYLLLFIHAIRVMSR